MADVEDSPHDGDAEACETEDSQDRPKRRPSSKRHWMRRFFFAGLAFFLLLVILVVLTPTIVSTSAGRNQLLAIINNRLRGDVSVDDLSLSWFGECSVGAISLSDRSGREVLRVKRLSFRGGVWDAISALESFDRVRIESPYVELHIADDGRVSLVDALSAVEPSPDRPDDDASEGFSLPDGILSVVDGTIRVVRSDGRRYDVTGIHTEVALKSRGDIDASLDMKFADGRKLSGEVELHNLVKGGELRFLDADGRLSVLTDGDVDMGPIADVVMDGARVEGALNLRLDAEFRAGEVVGDVQARLSGFQAAAEGDAGIQPIDVQIDGRLQASEEKIGGEIRLAGEAGTTQAQFSYRPSDRPVEVSGEAIVSALTEGRAIELPEFTLDAEGGLDLPALAKAIPGLLKIRPGSEITEGRLEIQSASVRGGKQPSAKALIQVTGLVARTDGRSTRWEPITIGVDVASEPGKGMHVRRAELKSEFGEVVAKGTPSDFRATLSADLQKVRQQFGRVFDLGQFELGGRVAADVVVSRPGDERVDLTSNVTVDGLRFRDDRGEVNLNRISVEYKGHLELVGDAKPRIFVERAEVDVEGRVTARSSGWYDSESGTFQAAIDVDKVDVGLLGRLAESMGIAGLSTHAGNLELHTKLEKTAANGDILTEGRFTLLNGVVDRQSLGTDVRGEWSGVAISPDGKALRVQMAKVESAIADLAADGVQCQFGDDLVLSGTVETHADLARFLPVWARLTDAEGVPDIAGRLSMKASFTGRGDDVALIGQGGVDGFRMTMEDGTRVEDRIRFKYDGTLKNRDRRISVRQLEIDSNAFSAHARGHIDEFDTKATLDLDGEYNIDWKRVTRLLHELSPATAEAVAFEGKRSGHFRLTGPASRPEIEPSFVSLVAGAETGWSSAEIFGVQLGEARLKPYLKHGRFVLPATRIAASGGWVRLGGLIDYRAKTPTLLMTGKRHVLDGVQVTPKLGEQLLCRLVPVFEHMVSVEGLVDFHVQDISLPLGEAVLTEGSGAGRLDLSRFKVQPGRLLAMLLELGGLDRREVHAVRVGSLDFVIRHGRILYDNFAMKFPNDFELVFSGSVGLDGTLDLVVSVPVRPALLKRFGVRGPVVEYARRLKDVRVEIPLVGTRENPRLDFSKVDVKKLLRGIIGKGLIRDLLGG